MKRLRVSWKRKRLEKFLFTGPWHWNFCTGFHCEGFIVITYLLNIKKSIARNLPVEIFINFQQISQDTLFIHHKKHVIILEQKFPQKLPWVGNLGISKGISFSFRYLDNTSSTWFSFSASPYKAILFFILINPSVLVNKALHLYTFDTYMYTFGKCDYFNVNSSCFEMKMQFAK